MKVHLIGVCGTAMATLAALLKHRGIDVQGSDQNVYPPMSDFLEREGIRTLSGYRPEHIARDLDLVVVGNAISRGNPELEEVLDRKVRFCSLPEAVRDHFLWQRRSVVIAGTHGKTTTTSLAAWVLDARGPRSRRAHRWHRVELRCQLSHRGQGPEFVIEGDEYDSAFFDKTAKFLKYLPDVAVVGNIEFDHADIYPDLDAILLAFRRFVNLVPRTGLTLLGADCPRAAAMRQWARSPVETFGLSEGVDWRAVDLRPTAAGTAFSVHDGGETWCHVDLPLLGEHNVRNALAAVAVAAHVGVSADQVVAALAAFRGVKRRLELRGTAAGVAVYDDFAHHPTAIAETLAGVRRARPEVAHLGDLRAALGDLVPPGLPAGVHRGLRRGGRNRAGGGLPLDFASGRATRRGGPGRGRERAGKACAACPDCRRRSSTWSRAKRVKAISSSSCPTAGSTGSTTSCWPRSALARSPLRSLGCGWKWLNALASDARQPGRPHPTRRHESCAMGSHGNPVSTSDPTPQAGSAPQGGKRPDERRIVRGTPRRPGSSGGARCAARRHHGMTRPGRGTGVVVARAGAA